MSLPNITTKNKLTILWDKQSRICSPSSSTIWTKKDSSFLTLQKSIRAHLPKNNKKVAMSRVSPLNNNHSKKAKMRLFKKRKLRTNLCYSICVIKVSLSINLTSKTKKWNSCLLSYCNSTMMTIKQTLTE